MSQKIILVMFTHKVKTLCIQIYYKYNYIIEYNIIRIWRSALHSFILFILFIKTPLSGESPVHDEDGGSSVGSSMISLNLPDVTNATKMRVVKLQRRPAGTVVYQCKITGKGGAGLVLPIPVKSWYCLLRRCYSVMVMNCITVLVQQK